MLVLCPSRGWGFPWYGGNSSGLNFQNSAFLGDICSNSCRVFQFFFSSGNPLLNSVLFPLQEILRLTASLETCSNAGEGGGVVCPSCFFC